MALAVLADVSLVHLILDRELAANAALPRPGTPIKIGRPNTTSQTSPMNSHRNPPKVEPLRSSFYQVRFLIAWTLVVLLVIVFTIIYAYDATQSFPFAPGLLFNNPSYTITVLNILSHVTVFALQTLTSGLFETI